MADMKEQLRFTVDTPLPKGVTREEGSSFQDIAETARQAIAVFTELIVAALFHHDINLMTTLLAKAKVLVDKVYYQMNAGYRVTLDDMSEKLDKVAKGTDELAKTGKLETFAGKAARDGR